MENIRLDDNTLAVFTDLANKEFFSIDLFSLLALERLSPSDNNSHYTITTYVDASQLFEIDTSTTFVKDVPFLGEKEVTKKVNLVDFTNSNPSATMYIVAKIDNTLIAGFATLSLDHTPNKSFRMIFTIQSAQEVYPLDSKSISEIEYGRLQALSKATGLH